MKNFKTELKKFLRLLFAAKLLPFNENVDIKTYRKSRQLQLAINIPLAILLYWIAIKYGLKVFIVVLLTAAIFGIFLDYWSRQP